MAPVDFVLCMLALIVGVTAQRVLLALEGNERFRRWRMARLRVSRIADVAHGTRVKLRGRVELVAEPLAAPVSGTRAIAVLVALEHLVDGRKRKTQVERAVDFRLRDDSGVALVRCARARVVCALPPPAPIAPSPSPSLSLSRLYDEAGVERSWLGTRWAPRVSEAVLAPDAQLEIVGAARREGEILIISADEAAPLYLALAA